MTIDKKQRNTLTTEVTPSIVKRGKNSTASDRAKGKGLD
jgi:hypothetical protein